MSIVIPGRFDDRYFLPPYKHNSILLIGRPDLFLAVPILHQKFYFSGQLDYLAISLDPYNVGNKKRILNLFLKNKNLKYQHLNLKTKFCCKTAFGTFQGKAML